MTKKFIKILIIFTIFFIVGIFYISLNKNSQYDTKYLIGYKIKNINYPNNYPSNEPMRRCPNLKKIKADTSFKPLYNLKI